MNEKFLFYDELGNEIEFYVKAKFSLDDTDYAALLPADDLQSDIYILKIAFDQDGDPYFTSIEGRELDEAVATYEELLKEKLQ